MIDLIKAKEEFLSYASNYDTQNPNIERKIHHTLRVMDISQKVANSLNLDNEKIELAELIGLLHDIGRFEQYTRYGTYKDHLSINHGELGVEILENNQYIRKYIEGNKYDEIIKKAIRNHNAYALEDGLTNEEVLFCNIIRDSDKIDIFYQLSEIFYKGEEQYIQDEKISPKVLEEFWKKRLINNKIKNTKLDGLIGGISFVFDINFRESFKIIKQEKYIDKMVDRFEFKSIETKEQIENIRKIANEYIEQKTK